MRYTLARAFFVFVGLLLVVAAPSYAQKPFADVTQEEIREAVKKWLKVNSDRVQGFGFALNADGLEYNPPDRIVWKLRAPVPQPEPTKQQVKQDLLDALKEVVRKDDWNTLSKNTSVEIQSEPIPPPRGGGGDSQDAAEARLARDAANDAAARANAAAADATARAKAAEAAAARAAVAAARARSIMDAVATPRVHLDVSYDTPCFAVEPTDWYTCYHRFFSCRRWCCGCSPECAACFMPAANPFQPCGCGSIAQIKPDPDSSYRTVVSMLRNVNLSQETVLQTIAMVPKDQMAPPKAPGVIQLVSLDKRKAESTIDFGLAIKHYSRGYSLFWQSEYKAALDEFDRAIESFPSNAAFSGTSRDSPNSASGGAILPMIH